jgi:hypothetical protein
MKTLFLLFITIIFLICGVVYASSKNHVNHPKKDTMALKCILYSADLFYGMELGEKPVRDMVDTLVGEIPSFDSSSRLNLVILSGRDLGFKTQTNIFWEQILDSAEAKGYELCPPQVAPELYVMSQNMPARNTIKQKVSNGRPIFIGMNRIRHQIKNDRKGVFSIFSNKEYFDYVFCIKSNPKKNMYAIGYSATNSVHYDKDFIWTNDDLFIFLNKKAVTQQICQN